MNFLRAFFGIGMALMLTFYTNISQEAKQEKKEPGKLRRIMIDAGHGGRDVGCNGKVAFEKEITSAVALRLGNLISTQMPDAEVLYTRPGDEFLRPADRAYLANVAEADVLISIHCNSLKKYPDISGVQTYVMRHQDRQEKVNTKAADEAFTHQQTAYLSSAAASIKPLSPIAAQIAANPALPPSIKLASFIQERIAKDAGRRNMGVRQENYAVLRETTMPSILLEIGFLSNIAEERFLMSPEGQGKVATAIFNGIKDYRNAVEKFGQ